MAKASRQKQMLRHPQSKKILYELSAHRLLSSQAPSLASSVNVTKSSFSRLEALRQRLANEDEGVSIDDFAATKSVMVRRKAAPRSAKFFLSRNGSKYNRLIPIIIAGYEKPSANLALQLYGKSVFFSILNSCYEHPLFKTIVKMLVM